MKIKKLKKQKQNLIKGITNKSVEKKSVEKRFFVLWMLISVYNYSLIRKEFPELSPYIPFYCLNAHLPEKWVWSQQILHESP